MGGRAGAHHGDAGGPASGSGRHNRATDARDALQKSWDNRRKSRAAPPSLQHRARSVSRFVPLIDVWDPASLAAWLEVRRVRALLRESLK